MALWLCRVLASEVLTTVHLQEGQKNTHTKMVIPSDGAEVLVVLCFKFSVCASRHNQALGNSNPDKSENAGKLRSVSGHSPAPRPQENTT